MVNKNNPLSNMSYTSKDFSTIYPELMELAKKLSNKWDPTVSNESDPGVVLIKENAILGDKLNYNIDKNVLETSPVSVTQIANARHLFEQLGYNCSWYRSATTVMGFNWMGSDSDLYSDADSINVVSDFKLTIPAFTVFTNADGSVPYTIYKDVELGRTTDFTNASGTEVVQPSASAEAIQGTPVVYRVHDTDLIKVLNLDDNNRLYFNDKNIAENGIFIWNDSVEGSKNYWKRVDNLQLESYGSRVFKFGVTPVDSVCYIEFPDDVTELFGDGVHITYIKTLGTDGNAIAYDISKFMQSVTVKIDDIKILSKDSDSSTFANPSSVEKDISTLVAVTNKTAALNGSNPESIDDAYNNYLKTMGVFKTLVSLNDYDNYINLYGVEKELTSKSYTADRTTDIQTSYCILTINEGIDTLEKQFIKKDGSDSENKLNPYNLKMFLLKYHQDSFTGLSSLATDEAKFFNSTFKLITNADDRKKIYPSIDFPENAKDSLLYDLKHIQHDIIDPETNSMCFIVNKYGIRCRIIPNVNLTSQAEADIKAKIRASLFNNLNAKYVEFGEEIDYNYIRDLILNSDNRINTVILDDITYTPHAAIIDRETNNTEFKSLESLDSGTNSYVPNNEGSEIIAKSVLNGNTSLFDFGGFPFKTNIENTNQELINDIVAIKSNYKLVLNTSDQVISDNGVVTILQPTTYGAVQIGAGYKFVLSGNEEIPYNEEYTLKTGLNLFYKSDSKAVKYTAIKYNSGTKIKFDKDNVNYTNNNEALINAVGKYKGLQKDPDSGYSQSDLATINAFIKKLTSVTDNINSGDEITVTDGDLNEFLSSLNASAATLASGETLSILADNVVEFSDIKKPINMSWIIVNNNPSKYNDLYTPDLVFTRYNYEDPSAKIHTYKYILKQGEFLYYTEPNANYVQELTEGFLIEIDTEVNDGQITFSLNDINNIPKASEVYMLGQAAIPVWRVINPGGLSTISNDTKIRINSIRFYEMKSDRFYAGDTLKTDGNTLDLSSSSEYYRLQSGTILSYKYKDASSFNDKKIDDERSFIKTSCLINSSVEKIENLIYTNANNYESLNLYNRDSTSHELKNVYFNTNLEINHDCSQLTRTISEDELGRETYLSVFKFNLVNSNKSPYDYSTSHKNYTDSAITITINTPKNIGNNKYMLIKVGDVNGEVSSSELTLLDIYSTQATGTITLTKNHWYLVDLNIGHLALQLGANSSVTIEYALYCNFNSIITDDVRASLKNLDKNFKFKADNVPEKGSLISNPIDGFELFNQSHYLYKYTIPMLDTSNIEITFVNMSNVRGR